MKNLIIVILMSLTIGCSSFKRLTEGRDSESVSVPATEEAEATPTPTPTPIVFMTITPLPSGTTLPAEPVLVGGETMDTLSGYLPNPLVSLVAYTERSTRRVGYVRKTSDGTWVILKGGVFSSRPKYTLIEGGLRISQIYDQYDAFCIYFVR